MRRQIFTALMLMAPAAGLAAQDTTTTRQDTAMMRENPTVHAHARPMDDQAVIKKMHQTHQLEIRAGQLAQRNGSAARVKSFGQQLVRDHQSADQKVTELARQMGVTLTGMHADSAAPRAGEQAANRRGERPDSMPERADPARQRQDTMDQQPMEQPQQQDTAQKRQGDWQGQYGQKKQAQDSTNPEQALQRLSTLRGAEFDAAFARTMVQTHARTITMLEQALNTVQREELKTLIRNTLPTVRQHHQIAQSIVSSTAATTTSSQ